MINFEHSPQVKTMKLMVGELAKHNLRPLAREYDEKEHEVPWELVNMVHSMTRGMAASMLAGQEMKGEKKQDDKDKKEKRPSERTLTACVVAEEMVWGDAGLAITLSEPGVGGAAVQAAGTQEQKDKYLKRFSGEKPCWGAFAITEPHCGSDTSAITTTAARDGNEWVINGEKIFVTNGELAVEKSDGFCVVWATVDKNAGRAGIKPFIVEAGTPGMKVTKLEKKCGIRASNTAAIVFENCRIPSDSIIGSAEVMDIKKSEGFKGVMATFDSTRPLVASLALGVGRAALDYLKELLEKQGVEIRYGVPSHKLTAVERDVMDMETNLQAARLLAWRGAWLLDNKLPNNLEAAMAKSKAGQVVTQITQKCAEIAGPYGFTRKHLIEKWFRDAKINDIYEGTGQIQMLIIARRILGYSREQLK